MSSLSPETLMHSIDWLQLGLFAGILALITKPLGIYLSNVLDPHGKTFLDPIFKPLERITYRVMGTSWEEGQGWKQYTSSILIFSFSGILFTYFILRFQHLLPLNPQGLGGFSDHLAFNTAISFATNTNWQSYGGESTASYFSQMVGLTIHNFTSASTGIAIAAALVRGLARHSATTLGNFWTDLVRITYYLLLPLSTLFAIVLVSQGVVQNFRPYVMAQGVEAIPLPLETSAMAAGAGVAADGILTANASAGQVQSIVQGPMASQVAIKMLGTNGGGYANANAAHPLENPNPLSNFLQMLSIFAIGSALTYHLGRQTRNQAHGWSVWGAMMLLFLAGVIVCWWSESRGNPIHQSLGVLAPDGNMEGKEVRFGIFHSALFATITTAASCGAVNGMHDSYTALGGLVPLFMMQLGEVVIGGVGAGLYGMLVFVVLAVFIAGLMVGRTPEYLGKKIEAFDVKMAMLSLLVLSISILGTTAWAVASDWGRAGLNNAGPHGFSEVLYAYTSATSNNGSAFAGLNANPVDGDPHYNVTLGFAMLIGRFFMIIPIMALAGSLTQKRVAPSGAGTFPVSGGTFMMLLIGTVLLVGALNFLPALALGPVLEHFLTLGGTLF